MFNNSSSATRVSETSSKLSVTQAVVIATTSHNGANPRNAEVHSQPVALEESQIVGEDRSHELSLTSSARHDAALSHALSHTPPARSQAPASAAADAADKPQAAAAATNSASARSSGFVASSADSLLTNVSTGPQRAVHSGTASESKTPQESTSGSSTTATLASASSPSLVRGSQPSGLQGNSSPHPGPNVRSQRHSRRHSHQQAVEQHEATSSLPSAVPSASSVLGPPSHQQFPYQQPIPVQHLHMHPQTTPTSNESHLQSAQPGVEIVPSGALPSPATTTKPSLSRPPSIPSGMQIHGHPTPFLTSSSSLSPGYAPHPSTAYFIPPVYPPQTFTYPVPTTRSQTSPAPEPDASSVIQHQNHQRNQRFSQPSANTTSAASSASLSAATSTVQQRSQQVQTVQYAAATSIPMTLTPTQPKAQPLTQAHAHAHAQSQLHGQAQATLQLHPLPQSMEQEQILHLQPESQAAQLRHVSTHSIQLPGVATEAAGVPPTVPVIRTYHIAATPFTFITPPSVPDPQSLAMSVSVPVPMPLPLHSTLQPHPAGLTVGHSALLHAQAPRQHLQVHIPQPAANQPVRATLAPHLGPEANLSALNITSFQHPAGPPPAPVASGPYVAAAAVYHSPQPGPTVGQTHLLGQPWSNLSATNDMDKRSTVGQINSSSISVLTTPSPGSKGTATTAVAARGAANRRTGPPGANLYVNNIDPRLSEDEIRYAFSHFGTVCSVKLVKEHYYGFVSFDNVLSAHAAIAALSGTFKLSNGRPLEVSLKKPRPGPGQPSKQEQRAAVLQKLAQSANPRTTITAAAAAVVRGAPPAVALASSPSVEDSSSDKTAGDNLIASTALKTASSDIPESTDCVRASPPEGECDEHQIDQQVSSPDEPQVGDPESSAKPWELERDCQRQTTPKALEAKESSQMDAADEDAPGIAGLKGNLNCASASTETNDADSPALQITEPGVTPSSNNAAASEHLQ